MSDETVAVTPEIAQRVVGLLVDGCPPGWAVTPIGGTEMATLGNEHGTTKDVDVVIVTIQDGKASIPEYDQLVEFAGEFAEDVETRKDHTCVRFPLSTDAGAVRVEFVRGRTPGKGGYFVSRTVLETAAELATEEEECILRLPIEALAFLKAWAASDKAKLVDAGKDGHGYHAQRRDAFLDDVQRLRGFLSDRDREPDPHRFETLFSATGGQREQALRRILEDRGWLA